MPATKQADGIDGKITQPHPEETGQKRLPGRENMVAAQQSSAYDGGIFIYRDGKKEAEKDEISFAACHARWPVESRFPGNEEKSAVRRDARTWNKCHLLLSSLEAQIPPRCVPSCMTLNLRYESLLRNRCGQVLLLPPDRVIESCFESIQCRPCI